MALINYVSWDTEDVDTYAYKFPETNLTTATQLLVHESQEAVVLSKGKIVGKFGPGKHTLTTENLPVLHKMYGLPFGKKNPFTAEVWFVNKRLPLNLEWTISNMDFADPEFKFVPLTASGKYGLRIDSAETFLVKIVGNLSRFTSRDITSQFQGLIEQNTKSAIISYMTYNQVRVTEISGRLSELSKAIKEQMSPTWDIYGLNLIDFYVTSIGIDTNTEEGRRIKNAIAQSSVQSITGYTWQQQQAMEVAQKAVSNQNGDMGIIGMAMLSGGFGFGGGGNGLFGNNMMTPPQQGYNPNYAQQNGSYNNQTLNQNTSNQNRPRMVFCSSCGKKYTNDNNFCPNCGNKYNPCPVCGADNRENAKRCVSCGSALMPKNNGNIAGQCCLNCGAPLAPSARFCPKCGTKI